MGVRKEEGEGREGRSIRRSTLVGSDDEESVILSAVALPTVGGNKRCDKTDVDNPSRTVVRTAGL